jgi:microcystin-dependent protein
MIIDDALEISFSDLDKIQRRYRQKADELFDENFFHNVTNINMLQSNYTKRITTPVDDTVEGYVQIRALKGTDSTIKTGLTPIADISPLSVGPYLGVIFREPLLLSKNSVFSIHIDAFVRQRVGGGSPIVKLMVFNANNQVVVGGQKQYEDITDTVITSTVSNANAITNVREVSFTQEIGLLRRNKTGPLTYFNPNATNQSNVNNGEAVGTIDGVFGTNDYYMTLTNSNSTPLNVYLGLIFTDCVANDCLYLKKFDIKNVGATGGLPLGSIVPYSRSDLPDGWLLCNGAQLNRFTYADLFAIIGTTYGPGNGFTTFNLPDLRGRTIINQGQGAGLTNRTIAATGGAETHTLTVSEIPSHNHTGTTSTNGDHTHSVNDSGHNHIYQDVVATENGGSGPNNKLGHDSPDFDNGFLWRGADGSVSNTPQNINTSTSTTGITLNNNGSHNHTFTTNNTGGDQPHNNMQPFFVLNYVIKSKYSATSLYF